MYDTILVAIDASPDSPDDSLDRTTQFAKMTGGTVHLLHVARGHIVPRDITAGAGLGITAVEDDADLREQQVVQAAVDQLAAAGIEVHGELIEATEHDVADVILQRAEELDVDIIVLGYQHHRGSVVAEHVIRQRPHCSILLARPPESRGRCATSSSAPAALVSGFNAPTSQPRSPDSRELALKVTILDSSIVRSAPTETRKPILFSPCG
jgi:nucleotide-binding universal stress UspA family protein